MSDGDIEELFKKYGEILEYEKPKKSTGSGKDKINKLN